MTGKVQGKKKVGIFNKFLNFVEQTGNKLPHPVTIFIILALIVILISEIVFRIGVSVDFYNASAGENQTVTAVSLLNGDGLKYMINSATSNFTSFAPLGTVLVAMLGVGVADGSGLLTVALKKLVQSTPKRLITAVIVFAGVMSNVASDAGYVALIPLGAMIFYSLGRHPIAGLAAAFAGVSGGFSANLLLGTLDPMLQGITNEALQAGGIDASAAILPTANYYFLFVSTFLIVALGTFVTEKIVEPRLGKHEIIDAQDDIQQSTKEEKRGLKFAGLAFLLFAIVVLILTVPQNAVLRGEDGTLNEFMTNGLITAIMLFFIVPGIAYGMGSGEIKNDKDVVGLMGKAMAGMGGYLVLAFFAAQFIQYFNYSNLGTLLAVSGAEFLKSVGFTGLPLVLGFIVLTAFINLFIGSASAKWAIMAPVFVPMMFNLGITPEFTQLAYRIADSATNIISPLMSYFAMIIVFAQKYKKDMGIGTLISTMLPYSMIFLIGWTGLLVLWYFAGWPIGPNGAGIFV